MDCPVCTGVKLVMSERQGIEIDYCPSCRGVWLDRGELDKMIDRALSATPKTAPTPAQQREPYREPSDYRDAHHGGHYRKRKREGFLADLFDFD